MQYYPVLFPGNYLESKPSLRPRGPVDLSNSPSDPVVIGRL